MRWGRSSGWWRSVRRYPWCSELSGAPVTAADHHRDHADRQGEDHLGAGQGAGQGPGRGGGGHRDLGVGGRAATSSGTPGAVDPLDLLRTLLDPTRLAVIGAVAAAPCSSADLAAAHDLDVEVVLRILAPLVQAGLVTATAGRYRLEEEAWRELARTLPRDTPASPRVAFGMTGAEAEVLARFFAGDRLRELPAQRRKRLVVLERLALEFEPGVRYDESTVNARLRRFHDDHASLRRALVDEGFLDRAAGEYWRAGGRVV